jgi:hypothetical protein
MDEQLDSIIKILQKNERLFDELESLAYYLRGFDEIKRFFMYLNNVVITSLCRNFKLSLYMKNEILFVKYQ